jgi:hypothetical protein
MALTAWSRTAANNTNANTGINFDENQAPSTVNDSARELEAQLVIGIQDSTLVYLTGVAGTNTITATAAASMAAYVTGQRFHFIPANTNSGATTININSIGAKNIFFNGVACVGNEIAAGIPATITYDGTQFQPSSSCSRCYHRHRADDQLRRRHLPVPLVLGTTDQLIPVSSLQTERLQEYLYQVQ